MREFTVTKNDAGQRLDRWLGKALPLLPAPLAQKYIRLKRVKVNGKGSQRDYRLQSGDLLQLYINDEFFDTPTEENAFLSIFKPHLNIVYEDENLLLLDKRPGMVVQPLPGKLLCPRTVQPHRPQYGGHRHRRQKCRGAAHHEPEDPGS